MYKLIPIPTKSSYCCDEYKGINKDKSKQKDYCCESFAYIQQEIEDPQNAIVQRQITGKEAKMLVILENGEQRLITFEVPKEDCTVQDLLDQANIYLSQNPLVCLVSDQMLGINYVVEISPKGKEEKSNRVTEIASVINVFDSSMEMILLAKKLLPLTESLHGDEKDDVTIVEQCLINDKECTLNYLRGCNNIWI